MKTRILGKKNSLTVSAIGMGCMGFSHGEGALTADEMRKIDALVSGA